MRTLKASSGAAAYGTTSAPSMASCSSGMGSLFRNAGPALQSSEKCINFAPHFGATRKSAPVGANQANEFVAFVDGDEKVFRGSSAAGVADPIDEKSGDVRFHSIQDRVGFDELGPGVEGKQGFGWPGRAGIQGDYFAVRRTVKEK